MRARSTDQSPGYEVVTAHGLTIYRAAAGQPGIGYLVMDEMRRIRVVLNPECAWRSAMKAKRKETSKLKDASGNWSIWFLLSRALVLSRVALNAVETGMGPAESIEVAQAQLDRMAIAKELALDARSRALLDYTLVDPNLDLLPLTGDERLFIEWFGKELANRLSDGDIEFATGVIGFVKAAQNLPSRGYDADVVAFRTVLAEQTRLASGPPTKQAVRLALGRELSRLEAARECRTKSVRVSLDPTQKPPEETASAWGANTDSEFQTLRKKGSATATDTFDEATFKRLLERTGFTWLPRGKSGPK